MWASNRVITTEVRKVGSRCGSLKPAPLGLVPYPPNLPHLLHPHTYTHTHACAHTHVHIHINLVGKVRKVRNKRLFIGFQPSLPNTLGREGREH